MARESRFTLCFITLGWFAQFSKKFIKIADFLNFREVTPSPVFVQLYKKCPMADFYRSSLKMV